MTSTAGTPAVMPPSTANRAMLGQRERCPARRARPAAIPTASSPRTGRSSRASRNAGVRARRGPRRAGGALRGRRQRLDRGEQLRGGRHVARGAHPAAATGPRGDRPRRPAGTGAWPSGPARAPGCTPPAGRPCRPGRALAFRGTPSGTARSSSRNSAQRSISSASVPTSTTRPASSTAIRSASARRGAAVRDQQRGAPGGERAQRVVDGGLGGGVDGGRGVVEHQHARVGEHGPGQRDPLALPAGQREPALADDRVVAVGQRLDERVAPARRAPPPAPRRRWRPGGRRRCWPGWCRRTGTPPRTPRRARGADRRAAAAAAAPRPGAARPAAGRRSGAAAARPWTCRSRRADQRERLPRLDAAATRRRARARGASSRT